MARCGCTAGFVAGPPGATGPPGPTGPTGPAGADGGGGDGLCAQKNVYTVGTPSHAAFAGLGAGTPEPFLSCADFVGNGVDDGIAIQAAIDAAVAGGTAVRSYPVVELLPGIFMAGGTVIDPKGAHIRGAGPDATAIMGLFGAQRIFDSDSGAGRSGFGGIFEDFQVSNTGGASFYIPNAGAITYFRRMSISGAVGASGDLASNIYQPIGNLNMENCQLANNEELPNPTVWTSGASNIMNNKFLGSGLKLDASFRSQVQGNRLIDLQNSTGAPIPAIALTGNGGKNIINGNLIDNVLGHGIFVDGTGGGQFDNTITNNLIYRYDSNISGAFDGIHLRDDTDANNVQGNTIRDPGFGGFGINIATADCTSNLVTNNDVLACGFNDAGTLTSVTAGNRL